MVTGILGILFTGGALSPRLIYRFIVLSVYCEGFPGGQLAIALSVTSRIQKFIAASFLRSSAEVLMKHRDRCKFRTGATFFKLQAAREEEGRSRLANKANVTRRDEQSIIVYTNSLVFQSYLLRFGLLGKFLGSTYLLTRCLEA